MSKITIGEIIGNASAGQLLKPLKLDIDLLIPSRLLIQANSGGGKSFLLRRLQEQLYRAKVQTIAIDPEGEFYTLREKFGFVLVGEGGETPADVRSASLLAEKFLDLKVSAVCDLYEAFRSRPMDRRQWVRNFLNALLDAPRSMWHPLVIIVDEAHKFCPQETPKAASMQDREIIGGCKEAMIALSTTGRKRGFCPIWATQRLAKVDKDASAEFFNRMVGMTIEDVDVDRAADLMSVSKDEKHEFRTSLRHLTPGQFYCFGRAIATERTLVKVGEVETHHPESGKQAKNAEAPPMPEEVAKFLPQLSDLPKEAENKARSVADLEKTVRELRIELKKRPTETKTETVTIADPKAIERAVIVATRPLIARIESMRKAAKSTIERFTAAAGLLNEMANLELPETPIPSPAQPLRMEHPPAPRTRVNLFPKSPAASDGDTSLPKGEQIVLRAIAQYDQGAQRDKLTVLTGYKRSTRDAYIQRLKEKAFVSENGNGSVVATQAGVDALGSDFEPLPTGAELQEYWLDRLPEGERKIFAALLEAPAGLSRESLEELTGYKRSTRDAYIRRLQSRRLVEIMGRGEIRPSENLFA